MDNFIKAPITVNGVHGYWNFIKCSDKVLKCGHSYYISNVYDKYTRLMLISSLEYEVDIYGYTVWFRCTSDIDRYFDIMSMIFGVKYICEDMDKLREYFGE
jgi:hypothetical protein